MKFIFGILFAIAALVNGSTWANAEYPEKSVTIILGYSPGGYGDFVGRLVASKLSEKWGKPVIVENRPGANGMVAESYVASAPPTGYVLGVFHEGHVANPALEEKMNYDPLTALAPITRLALTPNVLLVNPTKVPSRTFADLITYMKANPGKVNYGHGGLGVAPNLSMVKIMRDLGVEAVGIQFGGSGPAIVSLLGGEIDITWASIVAAEAQIKDGKLIPLAISLDRRWPTLPDVPTVAEAGNLPGFQTVSWLGLMAPANVPGDVLATIHAAVVEVLNKPDFRDELYKRGVLPGGESSEEFREFIRFSINESRELFKGQKSK